MRCQQRDSPCSGSTNRGWYRAASGSRTPSDRRGRHQNPCRKSCRASGSDSMSYSNNPGAVANSGIAGSLLTRSARPVCWQRACATSVRATSPCCSPNCSIELAKSSGSAAARSSSPCTPSCCSISRRLAPIPLTSLRCPSAAATALHAPRQQHNVHLRRSAARSGGSKRCRSLRSLRRASPSCLRKPAEWLTRSRSSRLVPPSTNISDTGPCCSCSSNIAVSARGN